MLFSGYMVVAPRVGEWVQLSAGEDPYRVVQVIYDLYRSTSDETRVRVMLVRDA